MAPRNPDQFGSKQERTPEGFLYCYDVPVARIGVMEYGPGETVIECVNGRAMVSRDADELFDPASMATMHGRPFVDEHPRDAMGRGIDVTPENAPELAKGVWLDPRRGEGEEVDLLICDCLVWVADAIDAILAGKREVSCGYVAEYYQDAPGYGRQTNIRYNHVALVAQGRCGPRCAIGDEAFQEERSMAIKRNKTIDNKSLREKLAAIFATGDRATFKKALDEAMPDDEGSEGGEGGAMHKVEVHNHMHGMAGKSGEGDDDDEDMGKSMTMGDCQKMIDASMAKMMDQMKSMMSGGDMKGKDGKGGRDETEEEEKQRKARFASMNDGEEETEKEKKKMEDALEREAPKGTGDRARRARDSIFLSDSYDETMRLAEAMAPGFRGSGTFDAKAPPATTYKAICGVRRSALELAMNRPETRALVGDAMGGQEIGRTTCEALAPVFRIVGAACRDRIKNDHKSSVGLEGPVFGGSRPVTSGGVKSVADLNSVYAKHYKKDKQDA